MFQETGGHFIGMHFGMHFFWWLFWLFLIVIAFATVTPVPRHLTRSGERALDILRRRYAAGQVTTEEYEQRKAILERDDPSTGQTKHAH